MKNKFKGKLDDALIVAITSDSSSVDEAEKILSTLAKETSQTSSEDYLADSFKFKQELEFLEQSIHGQSRQELRRLLIRNNGDVQLTVEEALSLNILKEEGIYQSKYAADAFIRSEQVLNASALPSTKFKKKPKKTQILVDILPSNTSVPISQWNSDDLQVLVNAFSLPIATIKSMYYKQNMKVTSLIEQLVEESVSRQKSNSLYSNMNEPEILTLQEGWPGINNTFIKSLYIAVGCVYDHSYAIMELYCLARHNEMIKNNRSSHITNISRLTTIENLSPISNEQNSSSNDQTLSSNDQTCGSQRDPGSLAQLKTQLKESQQMGIKAYRGPYSKAIGSQVAGYYFERCRQLNEQIYSSRDNNTDIKPLINTLEPHWVLDLHGFVVKDAVSASLEAADAWYNQSPDVRKQCRLTIITGRGIHSHGGVSRIYPAVVRALKQSQWKFDEMEGHIIVKGWKCL